MVRIESMASAILIAVAGLPGWASAATKSINCNVAGTTISAAVVGMQPGDTLLVRGTCRENVYIGFNATDIIIDGQGLATIRPPASTQSAVFIRGRGISLTRFRITGGSDGIVVEAGAFVQIYGNSISNNLNWGMIVQASSARIYDNTIQSNGAGGVLINRNADAMIGVPYYGVPVASPNTIRSNTGPGILVSESASAVIVGNAISNNSADGIDVWSAASASTASNGIDGNGGNGITAADNSAVNFGLASGTSIFELPNTTTTPNTGYGMVCATGAFQFGRRGSLTGASGAAKVERTCVGALAP